ncbi:MAG: diguanylate cyclase [Desulfovibrio sp.]|nr:diguanylate cyclase [Desulfovibrio sp.]
MQVSLFHSLRQIRISTLARSMSWLVAGIILASLAIFFSSNYFMHEGFEARVRGELETMRNVVDDYLSNIRLRLAHEASLLAESEKLRQALAGRDYTALKSFAQKAMFGANASFATIVDEHGIVLARGHSDVKGDDISESSVMKKALVGESVVDLVRLKNNGLSAAAAVPVFVSGYQVGVLLFGEAFRTHSFVDEVKKVTNLEMTIFDGDERLSTTIIRDGKRAIGTRLESLEARHTVLEERKAYIGEAPILGRMYKTVYWPLQSDEGETLGIWFIGTEVEGMERVITGIAFSCLVSTLVIAAALSVLGVLFFRSLVNPLEHKAYVDSLTGITNRAGFEKSFKSVFVEQTGKGALFLMDLDNFKSVNDNLGHPVGDEVLVHTAHALKTVFRGTDIVARLGGDEFVVYAPTMDIADVIRKKSQNFLDAVRKTYSLPDGGSITVTASIGIALFPKDGGTYEKLYNSADTALYLAKDKGRNRYVLYDDNMSTFSLRE